jgi:hypothetical protein
MAPESFDGWQWIAPPSTGVECLSTPVEFFTVGAGAESGFQDPLDRNAVPMLPCVTKKRKKAREAEISASQALALLGVVLATVK